MKNEQMIGEESLNEIIGGICSNNWRYESYPKEITTAYTTITTIMSALRTIEQIYTHYPSVDVKLKRLFKVENVDIELSIEYSAETKDLNLTTSASADVELRPSVLRTFKKHVGIAINRTATLIPESSIIRNPHREDYGYEDKEFNNSKFGGSQDAQLWGDPLDTYRDASDDWRSFLNVIIDCAFNFSSYEDVIDNTIVKLALYGDVWIYTIHKRDHKSNSGALRRTNSNKVDADSLRTLMSNMYHRR